MYQLGVSCKDCHDVHSQKLKQIGNTLCMNCHETKYDSPAHHFHKVNTEAAQCVNCHMTGKTYTGNDFRCDHSFRVPRPDQSVTYGTPNACNGCHSDKSAEWASEFIKEQYGETRKDHFSDWLLAGSAVNKEAYKKLMSDFSYPEIARATATAYYAQQQLTPQEEYELVTYLSDRSVEVRTEAVNGLKNRQRTDVVKNIEPLLSDSVRVVRTVAVAYFIQTGISSKNLAKAEEELVTELDVNADFQSGQHERAEYYQAKGKPDLAIQAYQKAIEFDYYNNTARLNLALLLYQKGEVTTAEQLYKKVIELEPDFAYSYYMLGLLYNEINEDEKALIYLKIASEKEQSDS